MKTVTRFRGVVCLRAFLALCMLVAASRALAQKSAPDYAWGGYDPKDPLDGMQGGWWFNLGPTGVRAKIELREPKVFVVKYVFPNSPGSGKIQADDKIVGVNGKKFQVADHFIYRGAPGKHPLGAKHYFGFDDGPRHELGLAIEESEGNASLKGKLTFMVERGGKSMNVDVQLRPLGYFSKNFPYDCKKSQTLVKEASDFIAKNKRPGGGGWHGHAHVSSACLLALLSQGEAYMPLLKDYFRAHADDGGGAGWSWVAGLMTIPTAEYYLATKDKSVLPLLKRQERTLVDMQGPNGAYMHKKWAPGGYSEMSFPAGLAGTAWALLKQCGIPIDEDAYRRTRLLLTASTRPDGGIGYGTMWTDYKPLTMDINTIRVDPNGARSTAGLFDGGSRLAGGAVMATMMHYLDPSDSISQAYVTRGVRHAYNSRRACTSGHLTGHMTLQWVMIAAGLATVNDDMATYRAFMDHWKSWLNVARCHNGGWYFEPTSDNQLAAWQGPRLITTSGAIMLLSVPQHNLAILGRDSLIPGVDKASLSPAALRAYNMVKAGNTRGAIQNLVTLKRIATGDQLAVLDPLESAAMKPVLAELGTLEALFASKDMFKLLESLNGADRKYKGITGYEEKAEPLRVALNTPEYQELIKIGRLYYQSVGAQNRATSGFSPKKGQTLQKAKEFVDGFRDTPYANLARDSVNALLEELNAQLQEIVELRKEGDLYLAAMKLKDADKEYGHFDLYVEKTRPLRESLFSPENDEQMKLGQTYQSLAAFAAKNPGTYGRQRLAAFAAAHPDTFYGEKAKRLAESGDTGE